MSTPYLLVIILRRRWASEGWPMGVGMQDMGRGSSMRAGACWGPGDGEK